MALPGRDEQYYIVRIRLFPQLKILTKFLINNDRVLLLLLSLKREGTEQAFQHFFLFIRCSLCSLLRFKRRGDKIGCKKKKKKAENKTALLMFWILRIS